jgi:hypothetical protein
MVSLIPLLVGFQLSSVQVVSVAGGAGSAKRLQAAVDACPKEGCRIVLPDAEYPMENMVWIRKRTDIQIAGTGVQPPHLVWDDTLLVADTTGTAHLFDLVPYPDSSRQSPPKGWLRWPDTIQPDIPGSVSDTTNEFSKTGFQHGGMFVVDQSQRIRFQRLFLDGRKTAPFMGSGINWLMLHGSVGISLFQSLAVDIVECEIARFWSAVYSTEWNVKCSSWQGSGSTSVSTASWSACGRMGGHLVERNRIHDNWYGFYSNSALDQGSVLRENLAWNNRNQYLIDPSKSVTPRAMMGTKATMSTTLQDIPGGFLLVSNSLFPVLVVTHNTLLDDGILYGSDGSMRGIPNSLWSDNIFDLLDSVGSTRISGVGWIPRTTRSVAHFWNNLVRHRSSSYDDAIVNITLSDTSVAEIWPSLKARDTVPGAVSNGRPLLVPKDTVGDTIHYDTFTVFFDTTYTTYTTKSVTADPIIHLLRAWNQFYSSSSGYGLVPIPGIRKALDVRTFPGQRYTVSQWFPNNLDSTSPAGIATADTTTAILRSNRICRDCPFVSVDPDSPGFLSPVAGNRQVDSTIAGKGSFGKDIGALDIDGKTSSHPPLRVRATGVPTYDKTNKQLLLPVGFRTEYVKMNKVFAWRSSITSGTFNPSMPSGTLKESALSPTAPIPDLSVTDSVIRIPLTPGANDTLIQVDLWLGGLSGTDTVAGTPMSWVWFSKAKGASYQTAFAAPRSAAAPRWRLTGRMLRIQGIDDLAGGSHLLLTDARGRVREVALAREANEWIADLAGLSRGVWIARLPGSTAWVFQNL